MIFVDTSGWLALANSNDRDHTSAREPEPELARGRFGKQVTTNRVLTETVTIRRRRLGLPSAVRFASAIEQTREVQGCWIEPVRHREAVSLMASDADQLWSPTDRSSFVVMKALGIADAFAVDHAFVQAGFHVHS